MENNDLTTINNPLDELLNGLRASMKLSLDMLDSVKEENSALRGMHTHDLMKITHRKHELHQRLSQVDGAIRTIIEQIAAKLQIDKQLEPSLDSPPKGSQIKLSDLLPSFPENLRQSMQQYKEKIQATREEIIAQSLINRRFTHDTLQCINDAIAIFTSTPDKEKAVYGTRGQRCYASPRPAMISREV